MIFQFAFVKTEVRLELEGARVISLKYALSRTLKYSEKLFSDIKFIDKLEFLTKRPQSQFDC